VGDRIKVTIVVEKELPIVWETWTRPEHITKWNFASDDWECPSVSIDLKEEGTFSYRMDAKDKSTGFDFSGTFTRIETEKNIEYILEDGRKVSVEFSIKGDGTKVLESFDPDQEFSRDLQEQGWLAILENFKKYTESI